MKEGIGTLPIGKNPRWKQGAGLEGKHYQEFVQLPHARFIDLDLQGDPGGDPGAPD